LVVVGGLLAGAVVAPGVAFFFVFFFFFSPVFGAVGSAAGLDHFVERERLTLTGWLPARPRLQLLPQAKITFGEK
jgi:hypothetical protein